MAGDVGGQEWAQEGSWAPLECSLSPPLTESPRRSLLAQPPAGPSWSPQPAGSWAGALTPAPTGAALSRDWPGPASLPRPFLPFRGLYGLRRSCWLALSPSPLSVTLHVSSSLILPKPQPRLALHWQTFSLSGSATTTASVYPACFLERLWILEHSTSKCLEPTLRKASPA